MTYDKKHLSSIKSLIEEVIPSKYEKYHGGYGRIMSADGKWFYIWGTREQKVVVALNPKSKLLRVWEDSPYVSALDGVKEYIAVPSKTLEKYTPTNTNFDRNVYISMVYNEQLEAITKIVDSGKEQTFTLDLGERAAFRPNVLNYVKDNISSVERHRIMLEVKDNTKRKHVLNVNSPVEMDKPRLKLMEMMRLSEVDVWGLSNSDIEYYLSTKGVDVSTL